MKTGDSDSGSPAAGGAWHDREEEGGTVAADVAATVAIAEDDADATATIAKATDDARKQHDGAEGEEDATVAEEREVDNAGPMEAEGGAWCGNEEEHVGTSIAEGAGDATVEGEADDGSEEAVTVSGMMGGQVGSCVCDECSLPTGGTTARTVEEEEADEVEEAVGDKAAV